MSEVKRALVVGAGICGLGVGRALAQRGVTTQVVEIHPEPKVAGVGINQPGNSLRALRSLGLFEKVRDAGVEIGRVDFHAPDGTLVAEVPYGLASEGIPNAVGVSRPKLHEILLEANADVGVELRFDCTVTAIAEQADGARVEFSDGRSDTFDLVVGADGINSAVRGLIFGDRFKPEFTGVGVWRLTVPRPKWVDSIGLYRVPRASAGYIPLSEDTMYLLAVCPEQYPARFDRERFPDMLRERLMPYGGLIAEIRDQIRDDDDIVYGPVHEVKMTPPWHRGRIVICGDAAHACTPHRTSGAAMAFEDAVVLAEEISFDRPLDASLTAFAERRYPRAKFVQDVSRANLDGDMALTYETMENELEGMRRHLVKMWADVDAVLVQEP